MLDSLFPTYEERPRGSALHFRIFESFVLVYTLIFAWEWARYIPQIQDVVLPLGIAQYVDVSFLFNRPAVFANAALITGALLVGWTRTSRWGYAIAVAAFHLQYVARYCLGEISHGSNMIGMSLLGLALATGWFRAESERRRFAFGFVWFFLGLAYTFAATCKLIGTGIPWADGSHLWLWMHELRIDMIAKHGQAGFNTLQQLLLDHWILATATLAFGWLAEASGWLLWFRRTRPWATLALVGMHLGITASMNIRFDAYVAQLLLVGLPWPIWLEAVADRTDRIRDRVRSRWARTTRGPARP